MSEEPLKILYLSVEVVPFAKTGGLADVAGALPKAIKALGHDIRVIMPLYGFMNRTALDLKPVVEALSVPIGERSELCAIWEGRMGDSVPIYFVDNPRLFDRDGIYMYPDDDERFIFYSRAAVETAKALNWQPDIFHCNDWHTGMVPNWMQTIYRDDPFFSQTRTVFTIHNLAYQGIFGHRVLEIAGVARYGFLAHPELSNLNNVVDLMGRALIFAHVVNTVSERYAQEIMTPAFGEGLDPILRDRAETVFGVLNGIDTELWDPASDQDIATNYDVGHLERRTDNKIALQSAAHLPAKRDHPLLGLISRLVEQKGAELLPPVIEWSVRYMGTQWVILGTGDTHYQDALQELVNRFPRNVSVNLTFSDALAHRIYAGSDIFLMPSRFEPCGLSQMLAMHYGAVPVVHETGGLADTVHDFDPTAGAGNGFTFHDYTPAAFYTALVRSVEIFHLPQIWHTLQRKGMKSDFSWHRSALKYVDLYRKAISLPNRVPTRLQERMDLLRHLTDRQ